MSAQAVAHTKQFLAAARKRLLVVTGAGVSTASGIPDYRSPGRPPYRPLTFQRFQSSHYQRQRYWARSAVGYSVVSKARPNPTHRLIAHNGATVITQNVDGLHQKAGSPHVVEMHGSIHTVVCPQCGYSCARHAFQRLLTSENPWFGGLAEHSSHSLLGHTNDPDPPSDTESSTPEQHAATARPDGDFDLDDERLIREFDIPPCPACGHFLMPNVVFVGDSLRHEVFEEVRALVHDHDDAHAAAGATVPYSHAASADSHSYRADQESPLHMLVMGSSLQALSALRLLRWRREADWSANAGRRVEDLSPSERKQVWEPAHLPAAYHRWSVEEQMQHTLDTMDGESKILIVNDGDTRGDTICDVKLSMRLDALHDE